MFNDIKDGKVRLVFFEEDGSGVVFALMAHNFKVAAIEVEGLAFVVLLHAEMEERL